MSEAAPVLPGNAGPDDYPRMLYHPDGRTQVVADVAEHEKAHAEGWATVPSAIHQQPVVSVAPILSGADPIAVLLRSVVEAVMDDRGLTKAFTAALTLSSTPTDVGHFPRHRR